MTLRTGRRWGGALALASLIGLSSWQVSLAQEAAEAPKDERPPLVNEDVPEPFKPKKPRTAAEADRLEAESLFAAGRLYEQREQFGQALKMYQRALRYDPNSVTILQQIWPLAYRLNRPNEVTRYAIKAMEADPSNQELITLLTRMLVENGDAARAVRLWERSLEANIIRPGKPEYYTTHKQMGQLYLGLERYEDAAKSFKIVQDALADPKQAGLSRRQERALLDDAAKTYEQFGTAYLKAGRLDEAVDAFKLADKSEPNRGQLAYRMAQILLQKKEPQKALEELDAYFNAKLPPNGREPYELLQQALTDAKQPEELIPRLEKILERDDENASLGYFLAEQLRIVGKLTDAEEKYLHYLKRSPDPLGYAGLSTLYAEKNDPKGLLRSLGMSIEQGDEIDVAGLAIAESAPTGPAVAKNEALTKSVLDYALNTLEKTPDEIGFGDRLAAAMLAAETKHFDQATTLFEAAAKARPDKPLLVFQVWGTEALAAERFDEAASIFRRILDEKMADEDSAALYYYHLAGALEMGGKTDDALKAAKTALAANPASPLLNRRVAWVLYHANRYEEALAAYKEIAEKFAGTDAAKEARLVLSNLYLILKDVPNAEAVLEEVLDEFPDDPSASNDLGYLWADQGKNLERSLHMIRLAVEADPDNKAYRDSLAWIYFRLGRYDEALVEQLKAIDDPEADATLHDHLGDIYEKLDKKSQAIEEWKKAVEKLEADKSADKEKLEKIKAKLELHQK